MGEHAEMSYSHSEVFFECAASFQEEAKWPPFTGNKYTEQGTAAHALGEEYIRRWIDGEQVTAYSLHTEWAAAEEGERTRSARLLDADDCAAVQVYVNYARQLQTQGYELAVEQRVSYGPDSLGAFGTVDLVGWHPEQRTLVVCDYKHGAGVVVSPAHNLQLLSYLVSVVDSRKYRPERMVISIIQPRCRGKAIKEWEVPWPAVVEHAALMYAKREAAKAPNPAYTMGEHCRWCRALQGCPEVKKWLGKAVTLDPGQVEGLRDALAFIDVIEPWVKAVRATAYQLLENGGTIEGWGLYPKQGRRAWKDHVALEEYLLRRGVDPEDIHSVQLLSPAQMQKALDANLWADVAAKHVVAESSGLKLDRAEKHKGEESAAGSPGEQLAVAAKRLMAARLTSGS